MFTANDIYFLQTLGEGAFGRVVLTQLKEEVVSDKIFLACKIIKKQFLLETKNVEHLKREIDILNSLYGYPFFPKLYSVFEFYDRICLLMDFCSGGEMFSYIRRHEGLGYDLIRFYAAEITLALKKLHSLNILYRDLKSENILLTGDGHIKLVDFGLSIRTSQRAFSQVGTTECMAPEVIKSEGYGTEADIWSFGILLYEMLHQRTPFKDPNSDDNETAYNILNYEPFFDSSLDSNYVDLVQKMLCKNPKLRLGSIGFADIMEHPFFDGIEWDKLESFEVDPPFHLHTSYDGDARYFDYYKESISSFDFPPMTFLKKHNSKFMDSSRDL